MSMISRYIFGTPLPTMAVIREIAPSGGEIPHFTVTKADGSVSFTTILGDDDLIFGLGENVRGINKRGHLYRAWNMDDFSHTENKGGILLGLDSDTFYIYHVAAVMVDNLRRLLLGINLSDKAIMDFDFPGVGFPV